MVVRLGKAGAGPAISVQFAKIIWLPLPFILCKLEKFGTSVSPSQPLKFMVPLDVASTGNDGAPVSPSQPWKFMVPLGKLARARNVGAYVSPVQPWKFKVLALVNVVRLGKLTPPFNPVRLRKFI